MIRGVVTSHYEATIQLFVIGPKGQRELIEAIVDTGFDGWLSLPYSLVNELELPWQGLGQALLADGSECDYDIHDGTVVWDAKNGIFRLIRATLIRWLECVFWKASCWSCPSVKEVLSRFVPYQIRPQRELLRYDSFCQCVRDPFDRRLAQCGLSSSLRRTAFR